jgi:uncharacterized membrane protein YeaQ/YmgE (transglycosylase-associated protein family)
MLLIDLILAALVGSLAGALANKADKAGWTVTAWLAYAAMAFSGSAAFVFIVSANLGGAK